MLKTGHRVEILTVEGDWTQVRLENGKEGWVLSRFLTDKEPHSVMLEQIKQQNEALSSQLKELQEVNEKQKSTNEWLESELAGTRKKLTQAVKDYEALKKESSEFIQLKTKYKKSSSELAQQTKKGQAMEAELNQLRLQKNIKWFLSGAGVLVVGFLLGLSAKRQRRRSSLM
jgi:SH3 domain protein